MKRLVLIIVMLTAVAGSLWGQRVEVGTKAPRIREVEWISDKPDHHESPKPLVVEFFHSSNSDCKARIETCNELAKLLRHDLEVVMLTREPAEQVAQMLLHEYQYFYVASDERGNTFRAFGVNHVPYAVVVGTDGKIVWCGNPVGITAEKLQKILQK